MQTDLSGQASPIFGDKFPYPLDGKQLLYELASSFAGEFNQAAKTYLQQNHGSGRVARWAEMTVTGAYPTTQQQCPRIAIIRQGSSPKLAGLGGEIETVLAPNGLEVRIFKGNVVTDTIEVSICTLNERMRDDLFVWFQQYMLDAIAWTLPQLPTVYDLRCMNAVDDQVEYQGTNGQPGFEFYAARLTYQVGYDLLVLEGVDVIKSIVNWQHFLYVEEDQS